MLIVAIKRYVQYGQIFFLFQFDKKEKLSYKRTNTTHKYFKVSGTNNRVKTPITVAHNSLFSYINREVQI